MGENIPYITTRTNKSGSLRYYWQRSGHKIVRLPSDPIDRANLAIRLNNAADQKVEINLAWAEDTLGWVISKYKNSADYKALAKGTLKYYKRFLKDILELGGEMPFDEISRADVIDFVESYPKDSQRKHCSAVLRNLFNEAMYRGCASHNLASNLRLAEMGTRTQIWLPEDIDSWKKAAKKHEKADALILAFDMLLYTAQRPIDVLKSKWDQYTDDNIILVRQQKTKTLVGLPAHRDLKKALEIARDRRTSETIVSNKNRQMSYSVFRKAFVQICAMAGIRDLQPRDLRRTAVVRLGQAGCTIPQIASVSGHTIDTTTQILEKYLPRRVELAMAAIQNLENAEDSKKLATLTPEPK